MSTVVKSPIETLQTAWNTYLATPLVKAILAYGAASDKTTKDNATDAMVEAVEAVKAETAAVTEAAAVAITNAATGSDAATAVTTAATAVKAVVDAAAETDEAKATRLGNAATAAGLVNAATVAVANAAVNPVVSKAADGSAATSSIVTAKVDAKTTGAKEPVTTLYITSSGENFSVSEDTPSSPKSNVFTMNLTGDNNWARGETKAGGAMTKKRMRTTKRQLKGKRGLKSRVKSRVKTSRS